MEIGTDFQGWPINAMTLREILEQLGIMSLDDVTANHPLLDAYPVILEDDGMGYGINPKYITTVDSDTYDDINLKHKVFNIFAEQKHESKVDNI
jgi:hypothetical protein